MKQLPLPALFLAALLGGLLTACAGTQSCQLPPSISLTVYDGPGRWPVLISGVNSTPAALLLDTGDSTSILTPNLAREAGLAIQPIQGDITFIGATGTMAAGLTTVGQFRLGTATARDAQFTVADAFSGAGPGFPVDGILGQDFLRDYDADVNLPQHNVTLYHVQTCGTAILPWQGAAASVPFREDHDGSLYVTVTIDGHNVEALLDSGATASSIPAALYTSSGLTAREQMQNNAEITGVGGATIKGGVYTFDDLAVGTVHMATPRLAVFSPLDYTEASKRRHAHTMANLGMAPQTPTDDNGNQYMTLGEDFIRQHRMFISHSTYTLYIQ